VTLAPAGVAKSIIQEAKRLNSNVLEGTIRVSNTVIEVNVEAVKTTINNEAQIKFQKMKQDKFTKIIVIGLSILFLIFFFSLKYINEISKKSKNDKYFKLEGEWITKEDDGIDFSFLFYGEDSLKIININNHSVFYQYMIKNKTFIVTDDKDVIFQWSILKITNDSITLKDGDDNLTLYKNW